MTHDTWLGHAQAGVTVRLMRTWSPRSGLSWDEAVAAARERAVASGLDPDSLVLDEDRGTIKMVDTRAPVADFWVCEKMCGAWDGDRAVVEQHEKTCQGERK